MAVKFFVKTVVKFIEPEINIAMIQFCKMKSYKVVRIKS